VKALDNVSLTIPQGMYGLLGANGAGANMQGSTFLLGIARPVLGVDGNGKEYGRDIMRKFLRYEIENYLRSRGRDRLAPGLRLEHP
jgi:ABC-type multidrug transport system ATPase subunit